MQWRKKNEFEEKIIYAGIAILVVSGLINGSLEKIEEKELDWRRNFQTGGKKSRSKRIKANKRGTKKQKRNKKISINIIE